MNIKGENGKVGNAVVGTIGARLIGTLPWRIDYSGELAHQFGPYAGDRVDASAGAFVLGWTVKPSTWKPRLSAEFDEASGDLHSKDNVRQTFDQTYAGNHSYYGIADVIGWRNMRGIRGGFEVFPLKKLKLQSDFNEFYLATTQDGLYNDGGTRTELDRAATSRHVGSELDIQGTYGFSRRLSLAAGLGHLFAGDYLKEASKGGSYNYPYITWTAKY